MVLLLEDCSNYDDWMGRGYASELEARLRTVAKGYFMVVMQLDVGIHEKLNLPGGDCHNFSYEPLNRQMWMDSVRHEKLKGTFSLVHKDLYHDGDVRTWLTVGSHEEISSDDDILTSRDDLLHSVVYRPSGRYRVRMRSLWSLPHYSARKFIRIP